MAIQFCHGLYANCSGFSVKCTGVLLMSTWKGTNIFSTETITLYLETIIEPRHEKTCLCGLRRLQSYRLVKSPVILHLASIGFVLSR